MYIPDIYRNDDPEEISRFIRANGFATLVTTADGNPWATHLPLMLRETAGGQFLHGHLSIENPQARELQGAKILAIFLGPDAYISSSWYDHENVPTWNYIAVHAYGTARVLDHDQTIAHLSELTRHYEQGLENPVSVEDLSEKTMRQARAIVAFEIRIDELHAKQKLSQNRDQANHEAVIRALEKRAEGRDQEIAREMRRQRRSD